MITRYLSIAGFTIAIKFKLKRESFQTDSFFYDLFLNYFTGFLTSKKSVADYTIVLESRTKIDIIYNNKDQKKYLLFYQKNSQKEIKTSYDIGIIQFSLLLREVIQDLLSRNNGFILHGSAIAINKRAIIFSAKSGAGKSTLVKLLQSISQPLADDMIIIRNINNEWFAFQTPFFEKNYLFFRNSKKWKIKAILIPKKAKKYLITDTTKSDSQKFGFLATQVFSTNEDVTIQLKYIEQVINSKRIPFGYIYFGLNKNKVIQLIKQYANQI